MWPKIMSSIKLSFFICYFPLWQHNRYFKRCYIKTGPTRPCRLETYPVGFWAPPRTAIPRPIWASLLISTLMVQSFPRFSQIFPCCSWWLLPHVLLLHTTQRHLAPSLKSHQLATAASKRGPSSSPSPGGTEGLSGFSSHSPAPAPEVPLPHLLQFAHICLVQGFPKKALEMWRALECWIDGSPFLGPKTSWDAVGLLCCQSTLLAHVQLAVQQDLCPLLFPG